MLMPAVAYMNSHVTKLQHARTCGSEVRAGGALPPMQRCAVQCCTEPPVRSSRQPQPLRSQTLQPYSKHPAAQQQRRWRAKSNSAKQLSDAHAPTVVDYAPSPTDSEVLRLPIKQELKPEQMTSVFGYPRDLRRRCGDRLQLSSSAPAAFHLLPTLLTRFTRRPHEHMS